MIDRRTFIGRVAGALLAVPLGARAQQPAMPVIGFIGSASAAQWTPFVAAFRKGLGETGYLEGVQEFRGTDTYGYLPPDNASDADIVRLLDETGVSFSRSAAEADAHARALLQAAAVALKAGDAYAAMTFVDGPEGAGIGWQLTRDEVQKRITERTPVKA